MKFLLVIPMHIMHYFNYGVKARFVDRVDTLKQSTNKIYMQFFLFMYPYVMCFMVWLKNNFVDVIFIRNHNYLFSNWFFVCYVLILRYLILICLSWIITIIDYCFYCHSVNAYCRLKWNTKVPNIDHELCELIFV